MRDERAQLVRRERRAQQVVKFGIPITVALAVAMLFVGSYAWLFAPVGSDCSNPAECQLFRSLNELLIWLLPLLCVVGGVTLATWAGLRDNRRRSMLIHDALTETADNLIDIALAYDKDKRALHRLPKLCLAKADELRRHATASGGMYAVITIIEREVVVHAESLLRSYQQIAGSDDLEDAQPGLEHFVESSLRLVLEAGRRHPVESASTLDFPGFEDLRRCLDYGTRVAFYSSKAEEDAPALAAHGTPIVCWFADHAPAGETVLPQFDKFGDIAPDPVA